MKLGSWFYRKSLFLFICVLLGLFIGTFCTGFLYLLQFVTEFRNANTIIILGLPFSGILIGYFYLYFQPHIESASKRLMRELYAPTKERFQFSLAPSLFLVAIIGHLFGASVGREGAGVEAGAALADQMPFINAKERHALLLAGAGAGFGSVLGTPISGIFFGLEIMKPYHLKYVATVEIVVTAVSAFCFSKLLDSPFIMFPIMKGVIYDAELTLQVMIVSVIFGITANFYIVLTRLLKTSFQKYLNFLPMRLFFGGTIISCLQFYEGSFRFAGVGGETLYKSLTDASTIDMPLYKLILTSLSIGSGYRGGEFIPLMFVGATLGSALAPMIFSSTQLLASLGFVAVVGAASKTPLTCSIMAAEIFGFDMLPYSLLSCAISSFVSGKYSFYERLA